MLRDGLVFFFWFGGEVRRSQYWLGLIATLIVFALGIGLPTVLVQRTTSTVQLPLTLIAWLDLILCFWSFLALSVKRCDDIGLSRLEVLWLFVPFLNLIWLFQLLFRPGGYDIKPRDRWLYRGW